MSLLYGFELETYGLYPHETVDVLKNIVPIREVGRMGPENFWGVCADGSISPSRNSEIKSRVCPTKDEIKKVIQRLQEKGVRTSHECGLHVHVSSPEMPSNQKLRIHLPTVQVFPSRIQYAGHMAQEKEIFPYGKGGRVDYSKDDRVKYSRSKAVFQAAHNHLEVRAFNAKLDPYYILRRIALVLSSLKIFNPALNEDPENQWTIQKIAPSKEYMYQGEYKDYNDDHDDYEEEINEDYDVF